VARKPAGSNHHEKDTIIEIAQHEQARPRLRGSTREPRLQSARIESYLTKYALRVYFPVVDAPTEFEWDSAKAESNLSKHGLSFAAGTRVFLDENRVDVEDKRFDYGEERRNTTGIVGGVAITVTYSVEAEGVARIISVRFASRKERKRYGQGLQDD
jgi:uncharacterized DUF497 family protein